MGKGLLRALPALLAGILVLAAGGASAAVQNVRVSGSRLTDTLQKASAHVTLVGVDVDSSALVRYEFKRVLPDGTIEGECGAADTSGCFRVPEGKVLLVTDIEWTAMAPVGPWSVTLPLYIENLADPGQRELVYQSCVILETNGARESVSDHLASGIVVSADGQIVGIFDPGGATAGPVHLILRGYLAQDR